MDIDPTVIRREIGTPVANAKVIKDGRFGKHSVL